MPRSRGATPASTSARRAGRSTPSSRAAPSASPWCSCSTSSRATSSAARRAPIGSDAKAREIARIALERGHDRGLCAAFRVFFYLPFEHSENLADQERAVPLYRSLDEERSLNAAIGHRDAIRRFGRFPHRNAVLGRENTEAEAEYLKAPPSWGLTAAEFAEWEREKEERERAAAG